FSVAADAPHQGICVGVSRVQWVQGVPIKGEGSIKKGPVGFIHRRVFKVDAEFQIVLAADPRIVIHVDPYIVSSEVWEACVDVDLAGSRYPTKRRIGNQTVGVGRGKELGNARSKI